MSAIFLPDVFTETLEIEAKLAQWWDGRELNRLQIGM